MRDPSKALQSNFFLGNLESPRKPKHEAKFLVPAQENSLATNVAIFNNDDIFISSFLSSLQFLKSHSIQNKNCIPFMMELIFSSS